MVFFKPLVLLQSSPYIDPGIAYSPMTSPSPRTCDRSAQPAPAPSHPESPEGCRIAPGGNRIAPRVSIGYLKHGGAAGVPPIEITAHLSTISPGRLFRRNCNRYSHRRWRGGFQFIDAIAEGCYLHLGSIGVMNV